RGRCDARLQLLVRRRARPAARLQSRRAVPPEPSRRASESRHVLGVCLHLWRRRRGDVCGPVVGQDARMICAVRYLVLAGFMLALASRNTMASGHGPVFGAATPTLGQGGWSLDQAWTGRFGDDAE